MVEALGEGFQFPLPGEFQTSKTPEADTLLDQEEALKRKRGLLLRVLQTKSDGELKDAITTIEQGFKAGSEKLYRFFYNTKTDQRWVDATPEDLKAVMVMRHQPKREFVRK